MTKEFKKAVLFIGIFIGISAGLSAFYSRVVMKSSILSRTDRQFYQFDNEIKYLIVGDSHSQYGLDPRVLGESFNFSSSSGTYMHTYYKLKYIFGHTDKRIKNVLMPFDLHSFSSWYFKEPHNSWYWIKYMDFDEIGRLRKKRMLYLVLKLQAYLASYIGERDSFLKLMERPSEQREIIDGYIPLGKEFDRIEALNNHARRIARYHFEGERLYDETLLHYFWKTLELCAKNDTRIILIAFPITKQYNDEASRYVDKHREAELISAIQQRYPQTTILNYRNIYFNNLEYFKDSDHLNKEGAEIFSRLVKEDL